MKLSHFRIKDSTTKLAMVIFTAATLVACKKTNPVQQAPIKPTAAFTFVFDEKDPKSVSFQNTSKDAVSFSWDFGDGTGTSTEKGPKHNYSTAGTYKVRLIVSSSTNTKDTLTKDLTTAYPMLPVPTFTIQTADINHPGDPSIITFQNTSVVRDGVYYQWKFGDGEVRQDNSRDPFKYQYKNSGKYQVTLTAMNNNGTVAKTDTAVAFVFKKITIEKVVLANMPQRNKSGEKYDDFDTGPDPYFTIDVLNKGNGIFTSGVIDNSFTGEWAINFTFSIDESIRMNFFDKDPVGAEEISEVSLINREPMLDKYPKNTFRYINSDRSAGNDRNGGLVVDLTVRYTP